ncbi:MAG: HAMP domain-containing protein, partial [Gemmatimonadetes bacterium]|nr:HAMP domain-containing protein [Gemmatimonadota bacterium]
MRRTYLQSLELRLPLVGGVLLLLVIAALSVAAYVEVRRSSIMAANSRLQSVAQQIADLLEISAVNLFLAARAVGESPEVRAYLRDPSPLLRGAALAALQDGESQPDSLIAAELRDASGRRLLSWGPAARSALGLNASELDQVIRRADSGSVGNFRAMGDTVFYPVIALVTDGVQPLGYVIHWRRQTPTASGRDQVVNLIGAEAEVFIGDTTQVTWTDLIHPVPAPPVRLTQGKQVIRPEVARYQRAGAGRRFAAAAQARGTPWVALVEFPYRTVLQPVSTFLERLAAAASGLMVLALIAAWLASRTITRPLKQLAMAADAFNHGDHNQRVLLDRSDELGHVAMAFNRMAAGAQQALVRREKLAFLGQLASGVAHELRNPLGVMTNAMYYLDSVLRDAPSNVKEYLGILRGQVELSEKIVSDLLDFARVRPPQREPVSVAELIYRQLERVGRLGQVKVHVDISEGLPPALVDQVQVGQVVLNLLTNAVQAMGEQGGSLEIRGAPEGEQRVKIEVVDTGHGIAPENLEKIFEPLFTT